MPATTTGREQAGVVLSKRGKVTAKGAGQEPRILKRGDAVYGDDVVHTVRGANVQLKMRDRNIVMLRGGSTFRVSIYHPRASSEDGLRYEYVGGILRESQRDAVSAGLGIGG
ncbi:MAG TPA: hypothetical protein PLE99_00625 [Candidatus Thiothrix moscowensis]|uniref:hypothetical protein n=1 Tax=unclassified Thiothrix TaxID=2636184 RepID=UPI001A2B1AF6|nr:MULTISPECIES: hypothetical protein [unclassified Thiothrix]MBJ6610350.1 hypothetical protein [Candidatus Thiothrix moscowensis]HRJ51239.1 hypothetical protein [Candidatus Thiothrix moscowensis]HRJ91706.1 hypothetical protein [Candidatus Thiothrix moscowensis]